MSEFNIHYVAKLARIALSREEEERLGTQLSQILNYVEKLKEVDVTGIEPTSHAFPVYNVFREDVTRPSLPQSEILANAPEQRDGCFVVPRIVGEG